MNNHEKARKFELMISVLILMIVIVFFAIQYSKLKALEQEKLVTIEANQFYRQILIYKTLKGTLPFVEEAQDFYYNESTSEIVYNKRFSIKKVYNIQYQKSIATKKNTYADLIYDQISYEKSGYKVAINIQTGSVTVAKIK